MSCTTQVQPLTAAGAQLSDRSLDLAGSTSCKQETENQEVSGCLLRNSLFRLTLELILFPPPKKKEGKERTLQSKTKSKLHQGESGRLDRVRHFSLPVVDRGTERRIKLAPAQSTDTWEICF